ncbi:MAG: hypothetical protein WAZ18_04885 [Alphaproteobacteria bacterium]
MKKRIPESLLSEFRRLMSVSEFKHADPAFAEGIASIMLGAIEAQRTAAGERSTELFLIDPVTNLKLPPDPRTSFRLRLSVYGSKMSASTFLKTVWKDYTDAHLLYAEHIRSMDKALYSAMVYEAGTKKLTLTDFILAHGVLGKEHLLKPPSGFERQARLLQRVRLLTRAHSLENYAATLREKDHSIDDQQI